MNRKRRTEILIQGDASLVDNLAEEIKKKYQWQEFSPPSYSLTMMKMRETAQQSLFHIGEVLVTEAKVEVSGEIGVGIIVGMKDDLANNLAIIDAAYKAKLPEIINWNELLIKEEQKIHMQKVKKQQELLKTKVHFDTMDVE
ncbi:MULTISPECIES: phosphonate C-P lyase system protein PhnG [Oceanobacillus]|uniref:Phosphonate C-P lyase system protein PhnG n=1 Tax=Oceanobacillus kimchii TaxID=746691 RepID=A0ABQ5TJV1_9BACI|nr:MULTISPECIES: phosphonate C-P lyase system protein PhnG [Oceanobacillus]MBT2599328.1 phosphonate C-P lyase system protein PhnG [Oceanobacillus sp. ISL-74]MBT2652246.1 phosphonate C-P lyase system protein PhnG [Oceanobacillus sp. ISL-73]GLO65410.1 hypothetical protein MACH08_11940 [Oceanobacillus kimchii]